MEFLIAKDSEFDFVRLSSSQRERTCLMTKITRHEAHETSAGDKRSLADAHQAGQLEISSETRAARALCTPEPPTDAARMAHNTTHVPFRDWGPFCVTRRGRSSPHRRVVVNKTADTLPEVQADYMFTRTVAESKTQTCITFVETRSGAVIRGLGEGTPTSIRLPRFPQSSDRTVRQRDQYHSRVQKTCARKKGENSVAICAKNEPPEQRVCRSGTWTHTGTRTMLSGPNRDEHWHTAFSIITSHPICNSSRWICAHTIYCATRRQNAIPVFLFISRTITRT